MFLIIIVLSSERNFAQPPLVGLFIFLKELLTILTFKFEVVDIARNWSPLKSKVTFVILKEFIFVDKNSAYMRELLSSSKLNIDLG